MNIEPDDPYIPPVDFPAYGIEVTDDFTRGMALGQLWARLQYEPAMVFLVHPEDYDAAIGMIESLPDTYDVGEVKAPCDGVRVLSAEMVMDDEDDSECVMCDGTGFEPCSSCNGSGNVVEKYRDGVATYAECKVCSGQGHVGRSCGECYGSGIVS